VTDSRKQWLKCIIKLKKRLKMDAGKEDAGGREHEKCQLSGKLHGRWHHQTLVRAEGGERVSVSRREDTKNTHGGDL